MKRLAYISLILLLFSPLLLSTTYSVEEAHIEKRDTFFFVDVLEERKAANFSRVRDEQGYFIITDDSTYFLSFWEWKAPISIDTAWTVWRMRTLIWSARIRPTEIEMIDGNWPHSRLHYRF